VVSTNRHLVHDLVDILDTRLMGRSLKSAKTAGTAFETSIANYLADEIDDRIERRRLSGAFDRGDISGLRISNQRLVVECKNYGGKLLTGPWLNETETERINDGAIAGFVVAKRKGTTDPAQQIVLMTLKDLAALINSSN
jgi:hypothetical protein